MVAWVLLADVPSGGSEARASASPGRADHAARRVERAGVERLVPLGNLGWCAELTSTPTRPLQRQVSRILGRPIEQRLNCDVGLYPPGLGYVVWFVEQPAPRLDQIVDSLRPVYQDIAWPSDPTAAVRVCLPRLSVPDVAAVSATLQDSGLTVRASYEVGGCRR